MVSSPGILAASETVVTELRSLPEGWWAISGLALLAVLLWVVGWMYRTEGRVGSSPRVRVLLAVLRCMVLLCLGLILLEPVRVHILRKRIESYAAVLVDSSSSMSLTDRYRDSGLRDRVKSMLNGQEPSAISRAELASSILNREEGRFVQELAQRNRVNVAAFAENSSTIVSFKAANEPALGANASAANADTNDAKLIDSAGHTLAVTPIGPVTNVERALRRTVESLGGAPLAGIVIFSDGGFNQGGSAEEAAKYAREQRVPLHVVGVGDPSIPRNVRVAEVAAPENAFKQDPFAITVSLVAQGLDGEHIRVQLSERAANQAAESRVIETRDVTVKPGGAIDPVVFERRVENAGRLVYAVEALPVEDESIADDNSRQATVNVVDSRTRVLLVSGGPSWDYRFISTLLQRDDTIEVACWLQSADAAAVRDGDVFIDHLLTTAEELFAYDVVLLLDPNKDEFDLAWAELIDQFVSQQGGGLLFASARPHAPSFLRERPLKALHDLLPVVLDPEADLVLNQIGHYQTSASMIEIPQTAYAHSIMRLGDDPASNRLAWQGIGEVYWHYPVLREKPVATVLMRHANPKMRNTFGGHVLSAVQFVGPGRTAYIGFDTTWRWRRLSDDIYSRFWVQMVRFLSEGKLLGQSRRGTLTVENENPSLGDAVPVHARLLNAQYEPLQREQVTARYEVDGEVRELVLTASPERPGLYEGQFLPDRTGNYRVFLTLPDNDARDPIELQRELIVTRPNLELLRPQMHRADLNTLAEESGGKYWEIDEASGIPAAIPDLHEEISIRSRPKTLWDNSVMLGILLGLLTMEWAIRKWNRLL